MKDDRLLETLIMGGILALLYKAAPLELRMAVVDGAAEGVKKLNDELKAKRSKAEVEPIDEDALIGLS